MTSSWKIMKRHGILLRGACKMVVELAISAVEEKLAIGKVLCPLWYWLGEECEPSWVRETFVLAHISPMRSKGT
jgi:hypothetical protein